MDEEEKEKMESKQPSKKRGFGFVLFFLFLIALVGAAFLQAGRPFEGRQWLVSSVALRDAKPTALEERLAKAEKEIAVLSSRLAVGAEASPSVSRGPDSEDLEKLKAGLAGLSGALELLQKRLEESSETTDQVRRKAQVDFATVVAFIRMQNAALMGQSFDKERQALRDLAGGDQALIDDLLKLEPASLTGAPDLRALQQEWRDLADDAQTALRKAAAQTWQERVLVAIESLVSIRSLKSMQGKTLSFAAIDLDLTRGDLAAALEKAKAFPPEVRLVVREWLSKAELRLEMERALDNLASHLIAREIVAKEKPEEPSPPEAAQEAAP